MLFNIIIYIHIVNYNSELLKVTPVKDLRFLHQTEIFASTLCFGVSFNVIVDSRAHSSPCMH